MTTGSWTNDTMVPFTGDCGPGFTGQKATRSWSGTNRLPGEDPWRPHAYTMTATQEVEPVIQWASPPTGALKSGTCTTCMGGGSAGLSPQTLAWTNEDSLAVLGKLQRRMQGSDFNLAVFLGEGKQSLSTLTSAATKIHKAYTTARRGNLRGAATVLGIPWQERRGVTARKTWSDSWLEMQYGWIPLLSDAKASAEQLAHYMLRAKVQRYFVRYVKRQDLVTVVPYYKRGRSYVEIGRQIVAYVEEDLTPLQISGLLDPELVAWELLPFSFVVDWWIPIGNYLSARAFAQKLKGTFVTTDRVRRVYGSFQSGSSYRIINGDYAYRFKSVTRTVSSSLGVPLPAVVPLSADVNWRRAANAVALLTQRFS